MGLDRLRWGKLNELRPGWVGLGWGELNDKLGQVDRSGQSKLGYAGLVYLNLGQFALSQDMLYWLSWVAFI